MVFGMNRQRTLGDTDPIRGGGADLGFTVNHTVRAKGSNFCQLRMHNGFVNIDDKMSKSLGFIVHDALKTIDGVAFASLLYPTYKPSNFTEKSSS